MHLRREVPWRDARLAQTWLVAIRPARGRRLQTHRRLLRISKYRAATVHLLAHVFLRKGRCRSFWLWQLQAMLALIRRWLHGPRHATTAVTLLQVRKRRLAAVRLAHGSFAIRCKWKAQVG